MKQHLFLSDLIRNAERDGSLSHGLFRLPAYIAVVSKAVRSMVKGNLK